MALRDTAGFCEHDPRMRVPSSSAACVTIEDAARMLGRSGGEIAAAIEEAAGAAGR